MHFDDGFDSIQIGPLSYPVAQVMKQEVICFSFESVVERVIKSSLLCPKQGKIRRSPQEI